MRHFRFFIPLLLAFVSLTVVRGQGSTEPSSDPYSSYFPSPSTYQWVSGLTTAVTVGSGVAWALSTKNIGSPLSLTAGGLVFGPMIGYIAVNEFTEGFRGALTRGYVVSSTAALVLLIASADVLTHMDGRANGDPNDAQTIAVVIGGIGGGIAATMAVIDIVHLGNVIERGRTGGFTIAPMIGENGTGIVLRVTL